MAARAAAAAMPQGSLPRAGMGIPAGLQGLVISGFTAEQWAALLSQLAMLEAPPGVVVPMVQSSLQLEAVADARWRCIVAGDFHDGGIGGAGVSRWAVLRLLASRPWAVSRLLASAATSRPAAC